VYDCDENAFLEQSITETRSDVAPAPVCWTREFWSELVNCTSSLRRLENQAELWGWKIRLVWEDGGRRGVVYLHRDVLPRQVAGPRRDLRTFVFTTFDPRAEARLLLDRLSAVDAAQRRNRV
jgi:hypothetical protein